MELFQFSKLLKSVEDFCSFLEIEYPIFQGGMAWVARAELVSAVSNAGGLGILGAGSMPPEILREEIRKTKNLTSRPFGVNVILLNPEVMSQLEVVLEENVPVVTMGAGDPALKIQFLKDKNPKIKVIPVVAIPAQAKRAEKYGADAVIAEGTEAGGHIGELSTLVLAPATRKEVSCPLIVAGGIVDGKGFVVALLLGAQAIQMGTRFVASLECPVHPNYKEAILKAKARDIVVTGRSIGLPTRVLRNKFTYEYNKKEKEILLEKSENLLGAKEELERFAMGRLRKAALEGDVKEGSLMVGQSATLIEEILPVKEIIKRTIKEAEYIILQKTLEEIDNKIQKEAQEIVNNLKKQSKA